MTLYRGHAPVPNALQLPPRFHFAQRYLATFDRDLRLRKSAEVQGFYVLERRKRRSPVRYLGLKNLTDQHLQARDGYDHVALVHANWLPKPHLMVRALVTEGWDIWGEGGHTEVADQAEADEQWAVENRQRRRKQMFYAKALEDYAILDRIGNPDGSERTRINNAGVPDAAKAA